MAGLPLHESAYLPIGALHGDLWERSSLGQESFAVDQPDSRFEAQARHVFGPFYRARVLETATGDCIGLANYKGRRRGMSGILTGRSSVQRAVKYGIQHQLRRQ